MMGFSDVCLCLFNKALPQSNYHCRRSKLARVSLNQIAPDFSLADYHGNQIRLADFRGHKNVLLVFNRTFK
jgi:hypothetical protein